VSTENIEVRFAGEADVADVLFWSCPCGHTRIRWQGAVAFCEECPLTSDITEELVSRGRADQRRRDIEWLLFLARKVRASRTPDSDILAMDLPLVPASILEKVSVLLANAPIGTDGS
jgi:hypothetical protein